MGRHPETGQPLTHWESRRLKTTYGVIRRRDPELSKRVSASRSWFHPPEAGSVDIRREGQRHPSISQRSFGPKCNRAADRSSDEIKPAPIGQLRPQFEAAETGIERTQAQDAHIEDMRTESITAQRLRKSSTITSARPPRPSAHRRVFFSSASQGRLLKNRPRSPLQKCFTAAVKRLKAHCLLPRQHARHDFSSGIHAFISCQRPFYKPARPPPVWPESERRHRHP
jgi:hypothetical protein